MPTTKTGVKITVDTSDIDIKFLKSVDQLNAGLTRTQKRLGLVYNEQGLLTNALGQTVEGLTTSQIRLGQYVDELGRVRTFQDGYTDGLSKTQLALGMYADELGNVYNATGEMIGQTDKAAKALEKEAAEAAKQAAAELEALRKAADETADKLDEIGKGIETATQQLGGLGANLRKLGDSLHNDTIKKAGSLIDTLLAARAAAANIRSLSQSITGLTSQLMKAKNAAQALDVVTKSLGGPLGVAAAGFLLLEEVTNRIDPLPQIQPLSDEFKKIEENARRAGVEIENFNDVLKNGAFSVSTQVDDLKQATERIKEAKDALDKAKRERDDFKGIAATAAAGAAGGAAGGATVAGIGAVPGAIGGAIVGGLGGAYLQSREGAKVEAAENEYKNVMAESNGAIQKYVESALENVKTAAQKLEEEKEANELILSAAKEAGAKKEIQAALEKQIVDIDKKIAEAKEQERQGALQAAGMKEYIDAAAKEQAKSAPTIEEFNKTLEAWKERVKAGDATQAEYNQALGQKQKEIAAQLAETYGIDYAPETKVDDSNAESDLKKRFNAGEIDETQYNALLASLKKKRAAQLEKELAEETDAAIVAERWREALEAGRIAQADYNDKIKSLDEAAKQEAERKREEDRGGLLDKLGLSSFEAPKTETPLESYSANMDALKEAYDAGIVNQDEYNATIAQLKEKAREAFPTLEGLNQPDAAKSIDDFKQKAAEIFGGDEIAQGLKQSLESAQKDIEELTANGGTLNAESLEAMRGYNKSLEAAKDAYEKGVLEKEEYDALLGEASASLAQSLEKQRKEVEASAEKEREARQKETERKRSELGIDSLLEEMKSPLEKYQETMRKIADAAKDGTINRKEQGLLEAKAQEDYWTRMDELSATAQRGAEKLDKLELGKSMSKGSESLYLAMVKQSQNGFQNKIQATTARIAEMQSQSLREAQSMNYYLSALVESGGMEVYRG